MHRNAALNHALGGTLVNKIVSRSKHQGNEIRDVAVREWAAVLYRVGPQLTRAAYLESCLRRGARVAESVDENHDENLLTRQYYSFCSEPHLG